MWCLLYLSLNDWILIAFKKNIRACEFCLWDFHSCQFAVNVYSSQTILILSSLSDMIEWTEIMFNALKRQYWSTCLSSFCRSCSRRLNVDFNLIELESVLMRERWRATLTSVVLKKINDLTRVGEWVDESNFIENRTVNCNRFSFRNFGKRVNRFTDQIIKVSAR